MRSKMFMAITIVAISLCFCSRAGASESDSFQEDTTAITWVLPGHFEEALERSKTENRLLIFKSVMFGVDAEGAQCATKGKW